MSLDGNHQQPDAGIDAFEKHDDQRYGTLGRLIYELHPIGGKSNPISPPFDIWIEGDVAYGRATLGWPYEAHPITSMAL